MEEKNTAGQSRCRSSVMGLMRDTGIYRLQKEKGRQSLVLSELEAYLSVLEPLEQKIDALRSECLVQTAGLERIRQFERMLGIPVLEQLPLEKRRKLALERMAIGASDFHLDGISRALHSAGLEAIVREQPGSGVLTIIAQNTAAGPLDLEEARKAVRQFLPAHLEADFQTGGLSFRDLAALDWSFAQLDRQDRSWNVWEVTNLEDLLGGSE